MSNPFFGPIRPIALPANITGDGPVLIEAFMRQSRSREEITYVQLALVEGEDAARVAVMELSAN
jgi:hypothetical protein